MKKTIIYMRDGADDNVSLDGSENVLREAFRNKADATIGGLEIRFLPEVRSWSVSIEQKRRHKLFYIEEDQCEGYGDFAHIIERAKGNEEKDDGLPLGDAATYTTSCRGYGRGMFASWVHIRDRDGWRYCEGDAFPKSRPSLLDAKTVARLYGLPVEYTAAEERKLIGMIRKNILIPMSQADQEHFRQKIA